MESTVRRPKLMQTIVIYVLLIAFAIFALVPMAWMFSTSIKVRWQIFQVPPRWIPETITFEHYERVILPTSQSGKLFGRYFVNSVIVSVATSVLSVVISAPAAYAFSRFHFPGKGAAYFGVLARNMFPLIVFLIPLFFMFSTFRLRNTYAGLIIGYLTFALPLAIWLLKGFFDSIPADLEEAAQVDGATRFGAFWRIVLPLTVPGMAATAIYAFITSWNEFPYALQLTDSPDMRTLPVGLAFFFTENTADWPGLMATAFVISIPVVIMFLVLQRYFVSALTQGAVKS